MKKLLVLLCAVVALLSINMSLTKTGEAASVAVVPIDIDVNKVERASDLNSYYWDLIIDRFRYPDYEVLDDDKVSTVVPEEGLKTFDKASLTAVADKVPAEIVVAMRISEVKETPKDFLREPMVECIMNGELATLNTLTGKYYYKKINYTKDILEMLTVRNDWQQEVFADYLRRGINRTLEERGKKRI